MIAVLATRFSTKARSRHGFTLTEIAVVLAIMGLILGAIWSAASTTYTNFKVNKAAKEIAVIISGYRHLLATSLMNTPAGVYTDVTCMGVDNALFPSDMLQNGVVCSNNPPYSYPSTPWGMADGVNFVMVEANPDFNVIVIVYNGLTQSQCVAYAASMSGLPTMIFQAINNGAASFSQYLTPYGIGTPWTVDQISGYCLNGGSVNQVYTGFSAY